MPRCTGIQILEHGVRAVELRGSLKNPRVARWAELPLPDAEGNGPVLGRTGRALLQGSRMARDPSVLVLPAAILRVRSVVVPFQAPEQIRKVIRTVMEEHLHGLPVEDALVAFHKVRDLEGASSRVLTVAADRSDTGRSLADLQAHGVDPQSVDVDLGALYNFGRFAGAFPAEGTAVILDLEADRAGLVVVRDGALQGLRGFRMTLAPPQSPVEPQGALAAGMAEPAPPDDRAVKLAREIRRSLLAEGLEAVPTACWVTGALASDETFLAEVREKTGLSFEVLAPTGILGEAPPAVAVCVGAALKMFGHDALHFDFRQGDLAFRRKFERVKAGLTVLSLLVFLVLTVAGGHLYRLDLREKAKRKALAQQAILLFNQSLRQEQLPSGLTVNDAMAKVQERLVAKMEELTGKGMDKDIPQIPSALARWRDLAARIRSEKGKIEYLTVNEIQLGPTWLALKGEADSPEALDSLLNVIRSDPAFAKAAFGSPPKLGGENRYAFHVQGEVGP